MSNHRASGRGTGLLITGLAVAVANLSLLQTLVVPVLSTIAGQLGTDLAAVGWVLTANLLAAAVLTPVLGRLGDVLGKRPVMLGILVVVIAGTVLALTTSSLPLLIVARVLQGSSYGLFPLSIAVLRDEVAPERLTMSMAVVSATLGVGGVVGLLASGLLTNGGADYHRIFWIALAVTGLALVLAWVTLPRTTPAPGPRSVDWLGALVLSAGLVLLLLPVSQGHVWGWTSAPTLGLLAAAVAVLTLWLVVEGRMRVPLVRPSMLAARGVMVPNIASLCIGFTLFSSFLAVTGLVETPRAIAGYGFGASVLTASAVYLLPGGIIGVLLAPFMGQFVHRVGPYPALMLGGLIGALGFGGLAVLHDATWQVVVFSTLIQAAVTFGFATLPALLVQAVEPADTGVANSVNSIARSTGSAIGSALAVSLVTGSVDAVTGLPKESAYVLIAALGAVAFAVNLFLPLVAAPKGSLRRNEPDPLEELEEATALAGEFSPVSALR